MPQPTLQNVSLLIINLLLVINLAWSWQIRGDSAEIERQYARMEIRLQAVEAEEIPPQIVLLRLRLLEESVALLNMQIAKLLEEIRANTHKHSPSWEGQLP